MQHVLTALEFGLLGYLCGSLPFAVWITRLVKGVDVRAAGSGHATTTNTIRQAGFFPGILVFLLDAAKGFLPTWLTLHYTQTPWVVALVAGAAVVVLAAGLAHANGAMSAVFPFSILVCLGLVVIFLLILRHAARASVVAGILLTPFILLLGQRGTIIWVSAVVSMIIILRFLSDWNRKYRELWLDREKKSG